MDKQINNFLEFIKEDKKLSDNTLQSYRRDIAQYEKYTDIYELVDGNKKADNEPTLNDLKKKAKEMGIEYDNKVTKAKLLELISAKENN